jgi:hypothetical protein
VAALLSPEVVNALITLAVTVAGLMGYHFTLAPKKAHPFLDLLLSKVDQRTKDAIEGLAESALDQFQAKATQPAAPPAPPHP